MDWLSDPRSRWKWWGVAGVLAIVVVWWLVRDTTPTGDTDPELVQIEKLERKKDIAGLKQATRNHSLKPGTCARAVSALSLVGGKNARAAVEEALKDDRLAVQYAAANALGTVGERTNSAALNEVLLDPKYDPQVRGAAAKSIGELRAWDGIEACVSALDDENLAVRQAAMMSVEQIIGLRFPYYKPDESKVNRQIAMEKIREVLGPGKRVYDRYWVEKDKPRK